MEREQPSDWADGDRASPRFVVLVFTGDRGLLGRLQPAIPDGLSVEPVSGAERIAVVLHRRDLLCALVIDGESERHEMEEVAERSRARWPLVEISVLLGSSSPATLDLADALGGRRAFRNDRPERLCRELRGHLSGALAMRRRHLAWLVRLARERGASAAEREILVLWCACRVPRRQLAGVLEVSESAVKKRMAKLLGRFGAGDLGELGPILTALMFAP